MRKFPWAFVLFYLIFAASPVSANSKKEGLKFTLHMSEWQLGNQVDLGSLETTVLIRKGDDIKNWKELVTIQSGIPKQRPDELLNRLEALREKECPGSTQWKIIERDKNSILYEFHSKPCLGFAENHEIARIVCSKHECFCLHYAAKVHELAPDVRAQWIKTFSDATITKEP